MPQGEIVRAWRQGDAAHLAVRVEEVEGPVEYIGSVPLTELAGLTAAQQRAKLVAAVKATRDREMAVGAEIAGITGTVTV